jgi:hypothetical protein
MPYRLLIVAVVALALSSQAGFCRALSAAERAEDFSQLVALYSKHYGMLRWKKEHLNVDLASLKARYVPMIEAAKSDEEFQRLCARFVADWQDPHLAFMPADERVARLGFRTSRVDGKAIITGIDRDSLPKEVFPFSEGDELVSIDGKSVERLAGSLREVMSSGNEESTLSLVYRLLAVRIPGWLEFPSGNATLAIRKYGESEAVTTSLPWIVTGKPLPGASPFISPIGRVTQETRFQHPLEGVLAKGGATMADALVPQNVEVHVVQKDPFVAYTMDTPKGPMGYLRLATFAPTDKSIDEYIKLYRKALKEMWFTKGLVVDLRNNGGGSLFYGYALAGMLTDKPLVAPTFSLRTTRENVLLYREWARKSPSASLQASIELVSGALEKAFASGEDFTEYVPLDGVRMIQPDAEVHYTKPIVVLINDQCYSMADIWPAILKDNDRVKLFGTNTAGAGGAVEPFGTLTHCEAKVNITVNILKRTSGQPIENLGVAPDVVYSPSVEDMANNLQEYRMAYVSLLMSMMN